MKKKKLTEAEQKAKYVKTCEHIESHLRRQGANAAGIQRAGKWIAGIQRHGTYRFDNFESFDEWREHRLKFSAEWTAKYLTVGNRFTQDELKGKQFGVQALAAIAGMNEELRPALLEHGQRHDASMLRTAYKRALPHIKNQKKAEEVLKSVLQRPEQGEDGGKTVSASSLPLPQHISRCKRSMGRVVTELRKVRERMARGESLPADERQELGMRLESLIREMWDLNKSISMSPEEDHEPAPTHH